jgi:uncharacterized protein
MLIRRLLPTSPRGASPTVRRACALALLLSVAWPLVAAAAIPSDELLHSLQPAADVNDYAGVLSATERAALEQRCRELREKTGAQLAVVILDSLQGGQIDDFTVKLFQRWSVGQAGKDNGIMLLVALHDRKARIEVGYGLEPVIPDALAGRILSEQLFPAFKQQRYAAGLSAAVDRIVDLVVRGEPAPANVRAGRPELPFAGALCFLLFLIPFTALPSFLVGLGLGRRDVAAVIGGSIFFAFAGFFIYELGLPWWGVLGLVPFDLAAGYFGYKAKFSDTHRSGRRSRRDNWSDGWSWGPAAGSSSWGGGGFSGGGSWGGFSGGHSGGGGASGGW